MGNGQSSASAATRPDHRKWSRRERRAPPPHAESSRVLFLLYLIHRTWNVVVEHVDSKSGRWRGSHGAASVGDATERRESLSLGGDSSGSDHSFCSCSYCRLREWRSDCVSEFGFQDMASCGFSDEQEVSKEKQRPPIYNPEDYAGSLKKWGKKGAGWAGLYHALAEPAAAGPEQRARTLPNQSSKDFRTPCLSSGGEEMSLRQFSAPSELLSKLRADLRLAFPSFVQEFACEPLDGVTLLLQLLRNVRLEKIYIDNFVQEFACEPLDGVTLLLELLRNVQLGQAGGEGAGAGAGRVPPAVQRRALLDELACLQCLSCCCARYPECVRRLVAGSCGLYTLTACIMSAVNKSRVIALQLLTKACNPPANGHATISEALSTLRLRYGEPVRFRFLAGMLQSAGGTGELQAAGLAFINALLASAPSPQRRLYIQAELEQAGFDIVTFKKMISKLPSSSENLSREVESYERQLIDVDNLSERAHEAQKEKDDLRSKLDLLEKRVKILQEEKGILISLERCLKEKCCELQEEVSSLRSEHGSSARKKLFAKKKSHNRDESSPPEDEGISSSERSMSPEGDPQRETMVYEVFNIKNETFDMVRSKRPIHKKLEATKKNHDYKKPSDDEEETTIDEVIQELRNIVNDAESEQYAKEKIAYDDKSSRYNQTSEINVSIKAMESQRQQDLEKEDSITSTRHSIHIVGSTEYLDQNIEEEESEIVPSKIVPHPPRKAKSLIHLFLPPTEQGLMYNKQSDPYDDMYYSSDEGSDSLLSASRYTNQHTKKPSVSSFDFHECRAIFNNLAESKERGIHEKDQGRRSRAQSGEDLHQKVSLKRSESFQTSEIGSNNDRLKHRRDQIDSLFYTESQSIFGAVISSPLQRSDSRSSRKGEDNVASLIESKKLTKSLDRIDEGLNSMVDIVMMSESKKTDWPYDCRRKNSTSRTHSDTKDGSFIPVSRSNSKQSISYGHQKFDSKGSNGRSRDEYAKVDANQKFFIPHPKLSTGSFENHSISSYNNTSFLVKRGHANAGFYSGQHFLRDAPASMTSLVMTGNHSHGDFSRALSPIGPKSISNQSTMGIPKVTDMPSGLY